MMIASECKACLGGWPTPSHLIGDCGLSQAYLFDDQFFPGWTVLVFKQHVTELFALAPEARGRFMEEVATVAQVLAEVYGAKKMNYELLGNQLPHMHWHLIPRRPTDPAPLEPVWRVTHQPIRLAADMLSQQLAPLRRRLHVALPGFTSPRL